MLTSRVIEVSRAFPTYLSDSEIVNEEERISHGVVYINNMISVHSELLQRSPFISSITHDYNFIVDCRFSKIFMMVPIGSCYLCEVMNSTKTKTSSNFTLKIAKDPDIPNFKKVNSSAFKNKLEMMTDNIEFILDTNGKTDMETSIINSLTTGEYVNVFVVKDISEIGRKFISANVTIMPKIQPIIFTARKSSPVLAKQDEDKKLFVQLKGPVVTELKEGETYALTGAGYKKTDLPPTHDYFDDEELYNFIENKYVNWAELNYLNLQEPPLAKLSVKYLKLDN